MAIDREDVQERISKRLNTEELKRFRFQKQNFEETTTRELKAKDDALMKLQAQKEELISNKIQAAAKQVLVEQKLDAIVD